MVISSRASAARLKPPNEGTARHGVLAIHTAIRSARRSRHLLLDRALMRVQMTDEMRRKVSEAIQRLTVTYRQRQDSLRKDYQAERARLEDMLDCSVVPRTKL